MKKLLSQKFNSEEWHEHFALFPVIVHECDKRYRVWLEMVERREVVGQWDIYVEYRFLKKNRSKAYCICGHEILQDEMSKIYDVGTYVNIVCFNCGVQTSWDLSAPVPLFLKDKTIK